MTPIFYVFANILGGRQYCMILLDFVAANIYVYFQYLFMHLSMRQYLWRNCFDLRFKIDTVKSGNVTFFAQNNFFLRILFSDLKLYVAKKFYLKRA